MFQFLNFFNALTWPIFESIVMLIWFRTLMGHHHFSRRMFLSTMCLLYVINIVGNGFESPLLRASVASTLSILVLLLMGWQQNIVRSKRVILLYAIVSSLLSYWVINFEMTMITLVNVPFVVKTSLDFLANVIALVVAFTVSRVKYSWLTEKFLERHTTQLHLLIFGSLFLRVLNDFLAYLFAVQQFSGSLWWDFLLLMLILVIIFVPVISNQHELLQNRINAHDVEITATQNYAQQLEAKYSEYRFFRHDYQNILASLEYGIQSENMSDIKHTYYSVIQKSNTILPDAQLLNLKNIIDTTLRSAILVKNQLAIEKSLAFTVDCSQPFKVKSFSNDLTFYRVIGILLDNAIEAAEKTAEKVVTVLMTDCEEIVIINSCTQAVDLTKITDLEYTTKENHSGFGLYFVKQYIKQHENIELTTMIEKNHFIQKLTLGAEIR